MAAPALFGAVRTTEPWLCEGLVAGSATSAARLLQRDGHILGFVICDTKVRRLSRRCDEVFIPKCGRVWFRWTRRLPGKPGMARVTLGQAERWHASFPAPQPGIGREPSGKAVGVDRGVRTALMALNGQHYRAPRIIDRQAVRYLGLQRNRARAKAGLNRSILASYWGILGRRLEQKAAASGFAVIYAGLCFTSQQCRVCGHTAMEDRGRQALFRCPRKTAQAAAGTIWEAA
jgi:transposase